MASTDGSVRTRAASAPAVAVKASTAASAGGGCRRNQAKKRAAMVVRRCYHRNPTAMAEPRIATAVDANALAPATIGGKAANLAALTRAGFPAPPWFCVTTAVFRTVIAGL